MDKDLSIVFSTAFSAFFSTAPALSFQLVTRFYTLRRQPKLRGCAARWRVGERGGVLSMRVIAGKYRSRPLRSLRGMEIRPTADRLRETLFNVLTAGNPAALSGTVWIDLFAGTGAVGMEALSRGAARVYFVESDRQAAKVIRENLAALGIQDGFELLECDAVVGLRRLGTSGVKADYVFLDPPWRKHEEYAKVLTALGSGDSILAPGALVLAEHEKKFDPGESFGVLRRTRKLDQGDAGLSFYWAQSHPD